MVFFTCNACNESLKKNQVEKHYTQKCRRCEFLSCVDCGKEFWGDTYQTHIKCISEDEKYSGKNYVAKVNKGEVKQEQWIQKVQAAIQKAPANLQLKNLLQKLKEFPNVPRKKAKFENFVKCSLRVQSQVLVSQVWDLLMSEAQKHQHQNGDSNNTNAKVQEKTEEENGQGEPTPDQSQETEVDKKLSKRERKEERRKKAHKEEKKDKLVDINENDDSKKKQKKRKKRDESEDEEDNQPIKKKRKGDVATESEETGEETERDNSAIETEKRGRFDWGAIIVAVLRSKGEISVKKLQKKVLAEYAAYGGSKGEERAEARFAKKLNRIPNVRVLKDRAKLISS